MPHEHNPDSLRELRYKAIDAARACLRDGGTRQAAIDAIHSKVPALADRYGAEVIDEKVNGIIKFACNQLRIEIPA